ncbi:Tyrosine-protein phosphatase 99A, partial [Bulinus truncatus]
MLIMGNLTKHKLFLPQLCFITLNFYTNAMAADAINKKVNESVIIDCPELHPDAKFTSVRWTKDTSLFATMGTNIMLRDILPGFEDRVKLTSPTEFKMEINHLEMKDTAIYECILYFERSGITESNNKTVKLIVQDKPDKPGQPIIKDIQSRQVTATWSSSENKNSPIVEYVLYIKECKKDIVKKEKVAPNNFEFTALELTPFTCYKVSVEAVNGVGPSDPSIESDEFITLEEAPSSPPPNLQSPNQTSSEIYLSWDQPPLDSLNGELTGYVIRYGIDKNNMSSLNITDHKIVTYVLSNLKPYSMYTVSIAAQNSKGTSLESDIAVSTSPGPPSKPRITHINNNQANSFYVNWEPPQELNGILLSYKLEWTQSGTNEPRSRFISGHLINPMAVYVQDLVPYTKYNVRVAAVTDGGQGEFSDEFPAFTDVAAPSPPLNLNLTAVGANSIHLSWTPPITYYKSIDGYIIKGWDHRGNTIGATIDKSNINEYTFKNLVTNSRYNLRVAGVTSSIFIKANFCGDFTEAKTITLGEAMEHRHTAEASLPPGVIVAIVIGVLLLVTVAALVVGYRFYNCRRLYQAAYYYLAVPSNSQQTPQTVISVEEPSEEKQYPDIAVADFILHVEQMHMDSDIGFSQEFDEINRTSYSDKYPCESSNLNDNRNKNRYINIVAYDHSRVVLKTELSRIRQSDYINANYVDGYKKPKAYIATQGPLPQTFPDFWRMIWEQNTSVIVMITNLMEKGRRKCDQYWPNDGAETYGHLHVKLVNTIPRAHYTVRIFTIKNLKVKK